MAESPSTRRDFLSGKSAADALSGVGGDALPHEPFSGRSAAAGTLSLSRRAMACEFQVQLPAQPEDNQTEAGLAALDLIDELEDRLSVYREHSEIAQLNRAAQQTAAPVDLELYELLQLCDRLYVDTGGAFDATTGPLSRAWGFFHRKGRMPNDAELAEAMRLVGWRHVQLDSVATTMRIALPGVEVNFNGVGKGFALDQAAELMLLEGASSFLLHGGRSTLVARGNRPGGSRGWGVGLRHPLRPEQRLAEFSLRDQAFSTSGSATQGFVHKGKRYGHLLDPRTGWPATGVHSVSVVCDNGAEADALSTAFYVMGLEATHAYCRDRKHVGALFVLPGDHPSSVRVESVNLPEECWRPVDSGLEA